MVLKNGRDVVSLKTTRAGEMTSSLKCLALKDEHLSSIPSTHTKEPGVVVHGFNFSTGEMDAGRAVVFIGQSFLPIP